MTIRKKKSVLRNKAYYLGVVSKKGKKSFYMRHIFQSSTDVPLTQIFQSSSAVDAAGAGVEGKKTYSLLMLSITVHRSQKIFNFRVYVFLITRRREGDKNI